MATDPAATSPMAMEPKVGPHGAAGSLDAWPASWMSMRPMPPRMPIETSATTAPTTAFAAASRRAGSR